MLQITEENKMTSKHHNLHIVLILSVLCAGFLLSGCGKKEIEDFPYEDAGQVFDRYKNPEYSTVKGQGSVQATQPTEATQENEQETPTPTVAPEPVEADCRYRAFENGGYGLIVQTNLSEDIPLPETIRNQEYEKLALGGMGKYMTALIVLKYADLTQTVTYKKSFEESLAGVKKIDLPDGAELTVDQLMYGMFVGSGNNAAVALACTVCDSEASFVQKMNEEARALGMNNTNFVNCTGLDAQGQYTTLYDMYLLMKECLKYDRILDYIQDSYTWGYYTLGENKENMYEWINPNEFVNGQFEEKDVTVIGGSVSVTNEAGYVATLLMNDKNQTPYIAIVMKASGYDNCYKNMHSLTSQSKNNY